MDDVPRSSSSITGGNLKSLHDGGSSGSNSSNSSSATLPARPSQGLNTSSTYASLRVDDKDPLSTTKPLRTFDRAAFEAVFPPATPSSSSTASFPSSGLFSASPSTSGSSAVPSTSSSLSPRAELEDPFVYPLLAENETRRLAEFWALTSGIHDDTSLSRHLKNLLTIVRDLFGFDIALLQFVDNDKSSSLGPDGWQSTCYPRRETGCAHTMLLQPGTVLNVPDFSDDWRFAKNPQIAEAQMRSYAGVPLAYTIPETGESVALGSLCIMSIKNKKPSLSQAQQNSLARFADLAMHAIKDRTRLRREAVQTRRHEYLSVLTKVGSPPSAVVDATIATLTATFGGSASFVQAKDGCINLAGVGRIAVSDFRGGIWENTRVLEDFVKLHNHESSLDYDPGCTVHAIAIPLSKVSNHYLVVETDRLRNVYDGTDTLFVQSCAMVIGSSIQDGLLRQALEAKTSFLRNVQHAFRTSLNGILSATDMLLLESTVQSADDVSKARSALTNGHKGTGITSFDLLRIVETSGRDLLTVVNRLIDLDAQNAASSIELCDLHQIEEDVLNSAVQHSAKDKVKDIQLVSDSRLCEMTGDCVMSDRTLLRQTLAALVQNAIEATSAGGVVMVRIDLISGPGSAEQILDVQVKDTGIGIAEADQHRIFQPFEKVDTFSQRAGLGLSFARQYATTLGGSIELLESKPNVGSVFCFRLPKPTMASSLQSHQTRRNLPRDWTFWMPSNSGSHTCDAAYKHGLESIAVREASTAGKATILIQPPKMLSSPAAVSSSLRPEQLLFTLGWDEDHAPLAVEGHNDRVVKARFPWTRNRLITAMTQAQKLAAIHLAKQQELITHAAAPVKPAPLGQASQIRALLVDDNAMNLSILQAYCKKRKYAYDSARDGQEAFTTYVKACEAGQAPNICLLDLQMPVCDGIACAGLMRAYELKEGRARCPIIMVTAQSGDLDRQSSLDAGTDAYYVKPLRISTLDDIIARYAVTI